MRFYTLDAMRGIAAIAVVILHIGLVLHLPTIKYGYMAVDFFFMLSGFVLARAYESSLKGSMRPMEFIQLRLIRLYPLFVLGVLIGAVMVVGQIMQRSTNAPAVSEVTSGFVMNMFMLPDLSSSLLFPFNHPAWSLFFELLINLVFCLALFRLKTVTLAVISVLACAGYIVALFKVGNGDQGWGWDTFAAGAARVFYAFPLGIIIARISKGWKKKQTAMALLPIAAIALFLGIDLPPQLDTFYACFFVMLAMPAILISGIALELPDWLESSGTFLGGISYPLYAIHYPLLQITAFVLARMLNLPLQAIAVSFLIGVGCIAWVAEHLYDRPVRNLLGNLIFFSQSKRAAGR